MKRKHALVLGATGATGQELVKILIRDPIFEKVSIFVRRKVDLVHEKLNIHVIDFTKLDKYRDLVRGDILFSALGTTLFDAGSKNKQFLVDFSYQYDFAKIASDNKVSVLSLVSSLGANENSLFFYIKIKGKLEKAVKLLNFDNIQIFQPPYLIRQPELIRSGEKIGVKFFNTICSFGILSSFKPISVNVLAFKMIEESKLVKNNKITIYDPKNIVK
tara:strand:- start:855 stop:1505 length:651 start_codon:yes stop_codon:yes gene_type:complete